MAKLTQSLTRQDMIGVSNRNPGSRRLEITAGPVSWVYCLWVGQMGMQEEEEEEEVKQHLEIKNCLLGS